MVPDYFLEKAIREKQREIDNFVQQRKLARLLNDDRQKKIRRQFNIRTTIMELLALISVRRLKSAIISPEPLFAIHCPVCGQEILISEAQLHERN